MISQAGLSAGIVDKAADAVAADIIAIIIEVRIVLVEGRIVDQTADTVTTGVIVLAVVDLIAAHRVVRAALELRRIVYEAANAVAADIVAVGIEVWITLRIILRPGIDRVVLRGTAGQKHGQPSHDY